MQPIEEQILSLLAEDVYNLWELRIQLGVDQEALAGALAMLFSRAEIRWYVRDTDASEALIVDSEGRCPSLADMALWKVPILNQQQFLVGLTDAGASRYYDEHSID